MSKTEENEGCDRSPLVSNHVPGPLARNNKQTLNSTLLFFTQESGESPEGAHARPLPLRVSALPTRGPAEGRDPYCALCPFCSHRPPLPPPAALLNHLLARSRVRPRPAPHHAGVSHPDVSAQRRRARLSPPHAGAHLPQPQPSPSAAVAVASPLPGPTGVDPLAPCLHTSCYRNSTGSEDSSLTLTCTMVSFGDETEQPTRDDGHLTFEVLADPSNAFGSSHLPAAVTFLNKTR